MPHLSAVSDTSPTSFKVPKCVRNFCQCWPLPRTGDSFQVKWPVSQACGQVAHLSSSDRWLIGARTWNRTFVSVLCVARQEPSKDPQWYGGCVNVVECTYLRTRRCARASELAPFSISLSIPPITRQYLHTGDLLWETVIYSKQPGCRRHTVSTNILSVPHCLQDGISLSPKWQCTDLLAKQPTLMCAHSVTKAQMVAK